MSERDRPADKDMITEEMIRAAALAFYDDDWGREPPGQAAERAIRAALAVAPWGVRWPRRP